MTIDLFTGFAEHHITCGDIEIYARSCGSGPPVLLLHGYPQTHQCWHKIAHTLAQGLTVVLADLRGYGRSGVPAPTPDHHAMSKRAMAEDAIRLMRALGHDRFALVGHDRGARAGYRLALDHPGRLTALAVLDILPTAEVWRRITPESAHAAYHWTFLAQPAPMPEMLIAGARHGYCEHTLSSWTQSKSLDPFHPVALEDYRRLFDDDARINAMCEDYRAGFGIDRERDEADRAAGRRIDAPMLALWGSNYMGKGSASPLEIWQAWGERVEGHEIASGHFLPEENPNGTLAALLPFLAAHASA